MSAAPGLRVALTGGIASGKTRVSDRLAELGACVIDTDVVAREVVAPGSAGLASIRAAFGDDMITPEGALDRAKMRALVFAEPLRRAELEAITHPLIRQRTLALAASGSGTYVVFVVPLLVGSEFVSLVDRVLVVDCPRAVQFERLVARDGETPDGARRILDAQSSRAERLAIADDVIVNDADLDTLRKKTDALHAFYTTLATRPAFARDTATAQN